jgi:hypothetical protein
LLFAPLARSGRGEAATPYRVFRLLPQGGGSFTMLCGKLRGLGGLAFRFHPNLLCVSFATF